MTPRMFVHQKTLEWLDDGLAEGQLMKHEFEVGYFLARHVECDTMSVPSYSATRVCRFYGEDATDANRKIYGRALKGLEKATRGAVRDDYRHCQKGNERTFRVFLPWKSPWEVESLSRDPMSQPTRPTDVPTNPSLTTEKQEAYEQTAKQVSQGMSQPNRDMMSIPNQETQNPEIESPPNLPQGRLLPLPSPAGGNAQTPPGSNGNTNTQIVGQGKRALDRRQVDALNELALRYVDFTNWLWNFIPNTQNVTRLLRDFSPKELLYVQVKKFTPGDKFSTTTMAHFFAKGARPLIENARLNKTSCIKPEPERWFGAGLGRQYADIQKKWQQVIEGPKAEDQKS
jgi:hypothetical protein